MAAAPRVPIRLLVQFQIGARPLLQVTEGVRDGTRLVGAGTKPIHLPSNPNAPVQLFDPATGLPLGEHITVRRALIILYSLTKG